MRPLVGLMKGLKSGPEACPDSALPLRRLCLKSNKSERCSPKIISTVPALLALDWSLLGTISIGVRTYTHIHNKTVNFKPKELFQFHKHNKMSIAGGQLTGRWPQCTGQALHVHSHCFRWLSIGIARSQVRALRLLFYCLADIEADNKTTKYMDTIDVPTLPALTSTEQHNKH